MSWDRFLVGSDLHGDMQDSSAVNALFKFTEIWKPKLRIFAGDLWDFRPLRRKAGEEEKRQSMKQDFDAGINFLNQWRPTHYLRGNHCERLWYLAASDRGVESDFALSGITEITREVSKLKCRMLPYHKRDGVLRIGHLKIIHGFWCGTYAARQTALCYGSTLFGHAHAIDEHAIPGLERRVARMIGCLCKLDMDYNLTSPSTLRHAHGFAYGVVNQRTGKHFTFQAEQVDSKWMLPSGLEEL